MAELNHYEILEIDGDADEPSIVAALAKSRRTWQARSGHPRLETRQLAEQRMEQLQAAEATLLDSAARSAYDRDLADRAKRAAEQAAMPVAGSAVAVPTSNGRSAADWLEISRSYVRDDAFVQARAAAREAVNLDPDFAEAWFLLGSASWSLGDRRSALFELSEAARLEPTDTDYRTALGDFHFTDGAHGAAMPHYDRALDIDPRLARVRAVLGVSLIETGRVDDGVEQLARAHDDDPEDAFVTNRYAGGLTDVARDRWSTRFDGQRVILSQAQLEDTRARLAVIDGLDVDDPAVREHVVAVRSMADHAEVVRMQSWKGLPGLILLTLVVLLVAWGISSINTWIAGVTEPPVSPAGGNVIIWIVAVLIVLGSVALFVRRRYVAGWKWHRRQQPPVVRASGLQDLPGSRAPRRELTPAS